MFPIIPHNFSTKSTLQVTCASVLASSTVQPRKRESQESDCACASGDIPVNTTSKGIMVRHIMEQQSYSNSKIIVAVNKEGYLENLMDTDNWAWITKIKISNDCQSYNVLLQMLSEDASMVVLCVVRPIRKGSQLSLWFSEEIIAKMSIPFLSPINIQGEKKYMCHQCGRHFEFPNPLKVHLALNCEYLKPVELWRRLQECIEEESNRTQSLKNNNINRGFLFKLGNKCDKNINSNYVENSLKVLPPSPENCGLSTASNPSPNCVSESEEDVRSASEPPLTRNSAFKPYFSNGKKQETNRRDNELFYRTVSRFLPGLPQNMLFPDTSILPPHSSAAFSKTMPEGTESLCTQQAVEMETLVSNLGRSKQGHLCLYCGKLYSRKYGLKIHIRTHTGFKPLKCKYCLRPFGDPSNLNKHVRLHAEGETPYKCEQCGKILVRRRDLERHIKSRHQHGLLQNYSTHSTVV